MSTEIDPVLLNLNVPLIDAVCASVCGDWFEAADLWFEVCREPRYRPLAVQCGAEAAVHAGLLDLAEYFYLGLSDLSDVPEFVKVLRERSAPVRLARIKYFGQRLAADRERPARDTAEEFMRLHFFREAVRFLLVSEQFKDDPPAIAPLLARAYWMLGAHAGFIGLCEAHAACFDDPDLQNKVARARRLLARQADPSMKNIRRFQEQHPAGPTFTAIVERAGGRPRPSG